MPLIYSAYHQPHVHIVGSLLPVGTTVVVSERIVAAIESSTIWQDIKGPSLIDLDTTRAKGMLNYLPLFVESLVVISRPGRLSYYLQTTLVFCKYHLYLLS